MKCVDAEKLLSQIDSAITDIKSFSSASPLEKSYLAKFLIVFISGIYEESIETIINEMVRKLGNSEVNNFIQTTIQNTFRNPDIKKIQELLGKFDNPSWKEQIKLLPQDIKDSLNAICTNKNALAHGTPVIITLTDVLDYYNKSRMVIEKIDDMLL